MFWKLPILLVGSGKINIFISVSSNRLENSPRHLCGPGTILEVDPESFSDLTSEVESLDEDIVGGSDDESEVPPLKGKGFTVNNVACLNTHDFSKTYAQIPISKNQLSLAPSCLPVSNQTRTWTPKLYWLKTMNWTGLGRSGRRESANEVCHYFTILLFCSYPFCRSCHWWKWNGVKFGLYRGYRM